MDGLTIHALVKELNTLLAGARIEKIHQPDTRDLVLTVRSHVSTYKLLMSAHKQFPRIHVLSSRKLENPERPPLFCVSMRKRIEGGRIIDIRQRGLDRVADFFVEHHNELGDKESYAIVVEMMGKNSNIILCRVNDRKEKQIIDAIQHVTPDMSRFRTILPGIPYKEPPALNKEPFDKLKHYQPLLPEPSQLLAKENIQAFVRQVAGLGPVSAREVLYRAQNQSTISKEALEPTLSHQVRSEIKELFSSVMSQSAKPSIGLDDLNRPMEYAPYPLTSFKHYAIVHSISEAVEKCFEEKAIRSNHFALSSKLAAAIEANLDKLRGKLSKISQLELDSLNCDALRINGELLTAYLHLVTKGQTSVRLPNFYDQENELEIALDPALTATQNAQRYFKQSSKRKRSIAILAKEREDAQADFNYLENVLTHVEQAKEDIACLTQIRHELETEGFIKSEQKKLKQAKAKQSAAKSKAPDIYRSTDGFLIRVGRNNSQNDRLTLKSCQDRDIWLHVKGIPGSHVVIETTGKSIPDSTLTEAALLAVFFSKARNSSNVPVDFTEIRHVWKPAGARPGQVLYKQQKTLFVTPDRGQIQAIVDSQQGHAGGDKQR